MDKILLLIPHKLPIKVKGKAQQIHKINNEKISRKFTAADDFSITRITLIMLYPINTTPGNSKEVRIEAFSHCYPFNNL